MKKIVYFLFYLGAYLPVSGQITEGRIVYERKMNMHKRLPPESEQMKSMIPEFSTTRAELLFAGDAFLYRMLAQPEDDIREQAGEDGNRIVLRTVAGGGGETYRNLGTGQMTELRELGPKKYLITDSIPRLQWKPTGESRQVAGYSCLKATARLRNNTDAVAWYTESIPVAGGPEHYGGLPGLILELDIDNGTVVFTAAEIQPQVDKSLVKLPSGGKKITRAEFMKLMEEAYGSGNGQPRIRIVRD